MDRPPLVAERKTRLRTRAAWASSTSAAASLGGAPMRALADDAQQGVDNEVVELGERRAHDGRHRCPREVA